LHTEQQREIHQAKEAETGDILGRGAVVPYAEMHSDEDIVSYQHLDLVELQGRKDTEEN
jgi:hypothetical protein